jgi:hypothetical protein
MDPLMQQLMERAGIVFQGFDARMLPEGKTYSDLIGMDSNGAPVAMDAAYPLVTNANAGIPAMLSTYIDPKLIEVLVAPMKAVEVAGGETKKGDWTTATAMFPVIEATGEVTSYGDYANGGSTGANFQFPQRQSYHYQTVTQWGELEMARAGLAKIDWAGRLNMASVLTLNKYQNKTYFFGVSGLQNYGLLNDPALPATLTPVTKAGGGTTWAVATANEVIADINKMFAALQTRTKGVVDRDTAMILAMSPVSDANGMTKVSDFNVTVWDRLKKLYPNLEVRVAPEYTTAGGELVQLIVTEHEGQRTVECAFTEKLRAHPIIPMLSSFKQKKSQGTWGSIIYRPLFVTGMIGT